MKTTLANSKPATKVTKTHSKRRALLKSYFSNALILAALLESAQDRLAA
jgi:hypothetical protein